MKSSILSLSTLLAAAALLSSCSVLDKVGLGKKTSGAAPAQTTEAPKSQTTVSQAPATTTSPLEGEWSIVEVNGKDVVVNGENHPKLDLQPNAAHAGDLNVIGYNGCNYINGVWALKGNTLTKAGEFISSLMLCQDAPYETEINIALNTVGGFTLVDEQNVTLNDATGQPLLKLRKRNLSFLNGAWRVTEIEGQPVPSTADVRIVIDIDECRVHGNAGCNILNGDITVNLDKGDGIEFKNLMTSRMMCPEIATEQVFLLALESVDRAAAGANADQANLLNSSGQTIISLKRLTEAELQELKAE